MLLWPDKKPRRSLQLTRIEGTAEDFRDKILSSKADAFIIDLEDSVPAEHKVATRDKLIELLTQIPDFGKKQIIVRVNSPGTPEGLADLVALQNFDIIDAFMLPKMESPADLEVAARNSDDTPLWLLIETAKGVFNIRALAERAAANKVTALCFGNNDYALENGYPSRDDLRHPRSELVLAARAFDLMVFDGGTRGTLDDVTKGAELSKELGFDGKIVGRSEQAEAVNKVFTPAPDLVAAAHAVFAGETGGLGAVNRTLAATFKGPEAERLLAIHDAIAAHEYTP